MDNCRNCGHKLSNQPILQINNMPKSAQFFPDENELKTEKGIDIILKQCLNCGLIQAVGKPVPYYRDVIRASGVSDEMRIFRNKQYAEWVTENNLKGKKIIEIGCGSGEYMNFMKTAGVKVYGIEHLKESAEKARKNGLTVFEGFIEDEFFKIPEAPYDGFYIMNFLEHIPSPGNFLRGIANNLTDEAFGLVEVPNTDIVLKKRPLYSEFIQDHLSYFTEETLINVIENNGFKVLGCESIWHDSILSARVQKRSYTDMSGFSNKHEILKHQIKEFMSEQKNKGNNIAVWGAGHQALANLSQLEMNDVKFVIDSAEFKQNKYTPATHIPIYAPERLRGHEVQMVIIMAAGYSNEVALIMDREFPEIEKVIFTEEGIKPWEK